jgi:hypothetical protein
VRKHLEEIFTVRAAHPSPVAFTAHGTRREQTDEPFEPTCLVTLWITSRRSPMRDGHHRTSRCNSDGLQREERRPTGVTSSFF